MVCSLCLLFAITSCGDAKPTGERLPDSEISDEDIVDVTPETSDEESADEETSDETTEDVENDDPDTTPEYDDEDVENDDFDTTPEYDDLDIELPECSASSETPCYDSSSGLIWSAKASALTWGLAENYCNDYSEGGLSSWRLPNIDELMTLLIAERVTNNCQISESTGCLAASSCYSCSTCTQTGTQSSSGNGCLNYGTSYSDGRYSKFGDTGWFCSSSTNLSNTQYAWIVDFNCGCVYGNNKDFQSCYVRCVR